MLKMRAVWFSSDEVDNEMDRHVELTSRELAVRLVDRYVVGANDICPQVGAVDICSMPPGETVGFGLRVEVWESETQTDEIERRVAELEARNGE